MEFDEENWLFPVEKLVKPKLYVCVGKNFDSKEKERRIFGGRLQFDDLSLPDVNHAYEKERTDDFHISLEFFIQATTLEEIEQGKDYAMEGNDSSVYAFGTHNFVDLQSIIFGEMKGKEIEVKLVLEFDFESTDRIGGTFIHPVETMAELEVRS